VWCNEGKYKTIFLFEPARPRKKTLLENVFVSMARKITGTIG
jgi:hypothetical protein